MRMPDLVSFAIYRGAKYYKSMKNVITDYDNGLQAFHSPDMFGIFSNPSVKTVAQSV